MSPNHRGSHLEVRTSIIKDNAKILKTLVGHGFFCPMVKANGYGHGVETVTNALAEIGVTQFGVATWDEALELRNLNIKEEILVFSRVHDQSEAKLVADMGFTPVVSRFEDLKLLQHAAELKKTSLGIHVKFDTGIHRMGFSISQADEVMNFFESQSTLKLTGILSHMSHGEEHPVEGVHASVQIKKFLELGERFKKFKPAFHLLNTQALLGVVSAGMNAEPLGVRPGMGLYGGVEDVRLSRIPALRVVSQIDHLQSIKKGDGVSYNWRWTAKQDSVVGIVPIGYGDGYLRSLGNKSYVLIKEHRVPVVGSVCMDYILVDLTELSKSHSLHVADEVVVMGEQGQALITPMELANWSGTIAYEILTSLGLRKNRLGVR